MNAADRLREFLAEAKLSQRGAARAMEIDERTMRRYCSGELPVPKVVWLALETVRRNRESMMKTRIEHNGFTIEVTRDNADQVRAVVDTATGESRTVAGEDWPVIDAESAAAIIGCDPGILRHYLSRLDYALSCIGAYLITDEILECERMASDPRAATIRVKAYTSFGAEFAQEMTLADALRRHASHRNAHQPQSGVRLAKDASTWIPDDDDPNGGQMEATLDRDPRKLVEAARELLTEVLPSE